MLVVVIVRTYTDDAWETLPRYLILLAFMAIYEYFIYRIVDRAMKAKADLPSWRWPLGIFAETRKMGAREICS